MSEKKYLYGRFAANTDIGKVRITNEDQALAKVNSRGNVLLLVCDGMGGSNKGDFASLLAKKHIQNAFLAKKRFYFSMEAAHWVRKTIREANKIVYENSIKSPHYKGMGTTITLVLILGTYMISAQVGDSRAYSLHNRILDQLTEDQTYVSYLYRTGKIKKEEMLIHPQRHVLMNALGYYPSLELDVKVHPYNNETILLCSDGLYNNVPERNISAILSGNDSPEEKITHLISMANANGGSDNIAVVVWEADK